MTPYSYCGKTVRRFNAFETMRDGVLNCHCGRDKEE